MWQSHLNWSNIRYFVYCFSNIQNNPEKRKISIPISFLGKNGMIASFPAPKDTQNFSEKQDKG